MSISESIVDLLCKGKSVFLTGGAGVGKCLGKNTPILMYDGRIKMVQDVFVGDILMGDDSTPRHVKSTVVGLEQLYKIEPRKGDSYVVNESHIISLVTSYTPRTKWINEFEIKVNWRNGDGKKKSKKFSLKKWSSKELALEKATEFQEKCLRETKIDIPLVDYISKPANERNKWKGYRVGVDFPKQNVIKDPYYFGFWKHLVHIPAHYKCNSREIRLELLAGIIDRSGHLKKNRYYIIKKYKTTTDDILYVARSLGFAAYTKQSTPLYWRTTISGDINTIPVRQGPPVRITDKIRDRSVQDSKINSVQDSKINSVQDCEPSVIMPNNKNHLKTRLTIKKLNVGKYYGFEIDGNHRFLLGDFTVTHNTHTTREIIRICSEKENIQVQQCATTGIAAIQLPSGRTLHSTFSLPIDFPNEQELIKRAQRVRRSCSNKAKLTMLTANATDILIIDEISMASAWLLDTLDLYLRIFRHKNEPFGGIMILAVGDFLQLPPVYKNSDQATPLDQKKLAMESNVWKTILPQTVLLTEVKRQTDLHFMDLLSRIRFGISLTLQENQTLSQQKNILNSNELPKENRCMYIAVRRKDVFEINEKHFAILQDSGAIMRQYKFPTSKLGSKDMIDELEKDLRENLYLSQQNQQQKFIIGQRVMCIANIDNNGVSLVNGDTGTVIKFHYMPSVISNWVLPLEEATENGEMNDENVKKRIVPVVNFDRLQRDILVGPKKFSREIQSTKETKAECSIYAFPLISCFASTVHKVQGCTLSVPVEINCYDMDWFTSTFYVALSRSTCLENVVFTNYHGKYKALEKARLFYTNGCIMNDKYEDNKILSHHVHTLLKEKAYFYLPDMYNCNFTTGKEVTLKEMISQAFIELDTDEIYIETEAEVELTSKKTEFQKIIEEQFEDMNWKRDAEVLLHPILDYLEKKYEGEKVSRKRKHILHLELDNYLGKDLKKIKRKEI